MSNYFDHLLSLVTYHRGVTLSHKMLHVTTLNLTENVHAVGLMHKVRTWNLHCINGRSTAIANIIKI